MLLLASTVCIDVSLRIHTGDVYCTRIQVHEMEMSQVVKNNR